MEIDGVVYAGSQDGYLYALDAATGSSLWSYETGDNITGGVAVAEGLVYVPSHDGSVYALDVDTGRLRWSYETGDAIWSALEVAGGTVYAGSDDDHVYALDASTGALRWRFKTDGDVPGSPTVADGTLYVGSYDDHLYAIDSVTGELKWKSELGGPTLSTPEVFGGLVYIGSWDDHLYALDTETGALKWNFWAGDNVVSSPSVTGGLLFIASDDAHVYALDALSGDLVWRYKTGAMARSSPVVSNGILYAGSHDGYLYALDAASGGLLWRYETGDAVRGSPVVADDTVYVGSRDGYVYAVGAGTKGATALPASSPTPVAAFVPLSRDEMASLLDAFLYNEALTILAKRVTQSDGTVTVTEISLADDVLRVFETGSYLLTGETPHEQGVTSRVLTREDYYQLIDDERGGSLRLKNAVAFCCRRVTNILELIVNGNKRPPSVIASLGHELGHARQRMINPVQTKFERDSNLEAILEAEAFAFEAALVRKLGEYGGENVTVIPAESAASQVRHFILTLREAANDLSEPHERGRLFLWLAVFRDPLLTDLKEELLEENILSPESLLRLYDRLVRLPPAEVDAYIESIMIGFPGDQDRMRRTLLNRKGDVPDEGFVKHSFDVFLVP